MNSRLSDGRWLYLFRCRDCGIDYERHPTNLPIGPMFETKAGDPISGDSAIQFYEEVMVYDGPRRELRCRDCLLKPCFPLALDPTLWDEWLSDNVELIESDSVLRGYVELVQRNSDGTIGFPETLAMSCLRCGGNLQSYPAMSRCPDCGSDHVNLISSHSDGRPTWFLR
ncbi:hypothetical protein OAG75_01540 [bacterium]|nr:hypothetical protein [bacterium]